MFLFYYHIRGHKAIPPAVDRMAHHQHAQPQSMIAETELRALQSVRR